jgi:hypothetical protein
MGAENGNELVKEMLDIYEVKEFKIHKNWYEYETNTMILSDILGKYFDRDKMQYQEVNNMAIFAGSKTEKFLFLHSASA